MIRYFKDNATIATRGLQIWQILIAKAAHRRVLSYKQLSRILGFRSAHVLPQFLDPIYQYCCQNHLPQLTAIVVNQHTGIPGAGMITSDPIADRDQVFCFDWFGIYPPSPEELESLRRQHRLTA
jgi:hypothetical protein